MFEQLWMSGILAAFSVFGIKAGTGLGVQVYSKSISKPGKILLLGSGFFIYLLLFLCMYLIVTRLNLLNYLDHLSHMLRYGMLVHLIIAAGLLAWGIKLLLAPAKKQGSSVSRAGLFLVVPCPICAAVILINLTLALSLSDLTPLLTTFTLFSMFAGIIAVTLGLLFFQRHKIGFGNGFLGAAMTLISLYFLMTVIIAPIYPQIKAAFAMAVSNNPVENIDVKSTLILSGISFALAGTGFIRTYFFKRGVAH